MTHFLQRTALIALASGAVGAYSTPSSAQLFKPNFPIRLPDATAPQASAAPAASPTPPLSAKPVLSDGTASAAPRAGALVSRDLAPLSAGSPAVVTPAAYVESDSPARTRRRRHESKSEASVPAAPRMVSGKVVEIDGEPENYTVRRGDTLEKIAKKLDTTVEALKDDNHLRHDEVKPGQVLKGPRMASEAYVANSGDTLFSIARRFSVTPDALRKENGFSAHSAIHPGEKIKLPQDYTDRGGPGGRTAEATSADTAGDEAQPTAKGRRRGRAEAQASEAANQDDAAASTRSRRRSQPAQLIRAADEQEVAESGGRMVTSRSVTGRVIEVEGPPEPYKVKRGDSLEKIAKRLDTTVEALKEDNHLRHDAVKPGQVLKGPRMASKAYVANSGDTLFAIAKRFDVTAEALRAENHLSRGAPIHAGQKLKLPEDYTDHGPLITRTRVEAAPAEGETRAPARPQPTYQPPAYQPPAYRPPATQPYSPPAAAVPAAPTPTSPAPSTATPYQPTAPSTASGGATPVTPAPGAPRSYAPPPPRTYTPSAPAPRPYMPPTVSGTVTDAQISDLGRGRFIWPIRGQIVSDFGPKTTGQRNDGINIGATVGAPVRAAAAGDVVYAGDQVPGFGNLVLIKHPDGWVTAYGHLSRVEVKMQQHVNQGEEVGLAGATGGVSTPQVHFEIRYASSPMERAKPVDPKLVLPRD